MTEQPHETWTETIGDDAAAQQLWTAMSPVGNADGAAAVDVDAAWARLSAAIATTSSGITLTPQAKVVRMRPRPARRVLYYAAAAIAVLAVLVGVNVLSGLGDTGVQYANTSDATMPVRLPDDSEVTLMPGSQLAYAEREGRREVVVAGEVEFDVTNQSGKSFAVEADQLQVVVVGTEFTVNHAGVAGVDVTEGHVRVRGRREADWTDVYAGGFARVEDGLVTEASAREQTESRLRFDEVELSVILAALTDVHKVPFTAATALRSCRITVDLADATAADAAGTLAAVLGAEAVEHQGGFYLGGGGCQ